MAIFSFERVASLLSLGKLSTHVDQMHAHAYSTCTERRWANDTLNMRFLIS